MKVAIIIGHRSKRQGAYSPFLDKTEYVYNKAVATLLTDVATVIERPNTPFTSEAFKINQVVKHVNSKDFDLVLSLHFNGAKDKRAHGATALHYITNARTKKLAEAFIQKIHKDFGSRKRYPIAISSKTELGGTLIVGINADCLLLEPFFGSNKEAKSFDVFKYANALREFICDIKTNKY